MCLLYFLHHAHACAYTHTHTHTTHKHVYSMRTRTLSLSLVPFQQLEQYLAYSRCSYLMDGWMAKNRKECSPEMTFITLIQIYSNLPSAMRISHGKDLLAEIYSRFMQRGQTYFSVPQLPKCQQFSN